MEVQKSAFTAMIFMMQAREIKILIEKIILLYEGDFCKQ